MNLLILVLSYNQPPFDALMKAQQDSWDSVAQFETRTVYYHGSNQQRELFNINGDSLRLALPCTDAYYYMSHKFKLALDWALHNLSFDFIFRTNSSSYVNKKMLVEFAKKLPKEKCYCGWSLESCVSGAGFFISRDCAQILADNIDVNLEKEEDFHTGQILLEHGIKIIDDKSRLDYPQRLNADFKSAYHIRFKTADRILDAQNMKRLHKTIMT